MVRMAPDDAQAYWLAPKTRSDQFLLFVFGAIGVDADVLTTDLLARAQGIDDLNLVVRETFADLDYPYWVRSAARRDQFDVRGSTGLSWGECLDDVAASITAQLDPRRAAWRLLLYPGVADTPDGGGPGSVAVLQISHALADGRRSAALARQLFAGVEPRAASGGDRPGGSAPLAQHTVPAAAAVSGILRLPGQLGGIAVRGRRAYELSKDEVIGPAGAVPGPLNVAPGDDRQLRVVVVDASALRIGSYGITTGAIVAISNALIQAGLAPPRASVELTIARDSAGPARNDFFTAGIDARLDIADPIRRAAAVAAGIDDARRRDRAPGRGGGGRPPPPPPPRDRAPGRVAARHAAAATPALLMHWGALAFDPAARSSTVSGHTVVSSVNRGAADLTLGAGRVRFTTGFPALSGMQGLTHGVHGIGAVVAISVTTSRAVLPDVDAYVEHLRGAIADLGPR